jgi:hypothetical protein
MVAFFNPLISFLSIYTYCTSEMLPSVIHAYFLIDALISSQVIVLSGLIS